MYSSLLLKFLPEFPRTFTIFGSRRKILADLHATKPYTNTLPVIMKIIILIIFLITISSCRSQVEIPKNVIELEKYIEQNDTVNLRRYHRNFNSDFASDWKIHNIDSRVEIGHWTFGYYFEWTRKKSDTTINRTYTLDINGNFLSCSEKRELNNKLLSRGGVYFENGALNYISQIYPDRTDNILAVGKYEYELYNNGKLVSIYRTRHLNHFYMLTEEKNKNKVELIYGIDYLNVKE